MVASCSAGRWAAWPAGGGGIGVGSSRSANGGARGCKLQEAAAEPAQLVTIMVCAGRWGLGLGGGGGGRTGLSGEKQGRELAEWRSQGTELAEWRSQQRELAESAAGCRTAETGCRTEPAQAVHIPIGGLWVSHWKGLRPSQCMPLVECIACLSSQCFTRLCQRMSQTAGKSTLVGTSVGQWVVERWPTVHSNRAPRMGAARNWVLRGHCQAGPSGFLSGSTLCSRTRGVLQAEGREGGLG